MPSAAPPLAGMLRWAEVRLEPISGEDARLEAEVLLAHALSMSRTRLYADLRRPATEDEQRRYAGLLKRRLVGEPVAYITGRREFFGLELEVDHRVMIPRPETERLVEVVLQALRERQEPSGGWRLADVGTGSGAVAIALAKSLPRARVYALETDAGALEVAERNCQRHGVDERVVLLKSDLLTALPVPVDGVAANLPYVPREELPCLAPEVRDHEPALALDGGQGGLEVYRRLLAQVMGRVRPRGFLALEIGQGQAEASLELVRQHLPGAKTEVFLDYAGTPRVVRVDLRD